MIHLVEELKWPVSCAANRFDLFVNEVILCYGCERVGLEDESSFAGAMWVWVRRWKRTNVASVPRNLNLTD